MIYAVNGKDSFMHICAPLMKIKKSVFLLSCSAISDVDLKVLTFTDFGKDFPKAQKLSPDSFIQNAIQLAYYR